MLVVLFEVNGIEKIFLSFLDFAKKEAKITPTNNY